MDLTRVRNYLNPLDITVVAYHHNCLDGHGCLFALQNINKNIELIRCTHGMNHESLLDFLDKDDCLLMVDFTVEYQIYMKIKNLVSKFVILDHHYSAYNNLRIKNRSDIYSQSDIYLNMNYAACLITWEYCYPGQSIPLFLLYIQDHDLWQWNHSFSLPFTLALESFDIDFNNWNKYLIEENIVDMIEKGEILYKSMMNNIRLMASKSDIRIFEGYKTIVMNCTSYLNYAASYLLDNYECDLVMIWYYDSLNYIYRISLRSEIVDCAYLAEIYEGGGHKKASGFKWEYDIEELFN